MGSCEPSRTNSKQVGHRKTTTHKEKDIDGSGGSFDVRTPQPPKERMKKVENQEINEYNQILSDIDYEMGMKDIGESPGNQNHAEKVQWSNQKKKPNSLVPPKPKHSLWAEMNGKKKSSSGAIKTDCE